MKYEFDLFFRIISGDLSPGSNAETGYKRYITFLESNFRECIKLYTIHFRQNTSGEYVLQHVKEYAFLDLPETLSQNASAGIDVQLLEELIAKSLSSLTIAPESIRKSKYRKNRKEVYLEITAQVEFAHLSPQEARFYYYRTLLDKEVKRVKRSLHHHSFGLQSEKQIELFIQNHQLTLETLTQSILSYLDEEERRSIYSLSGQYSLSDLYKIIYYSLEKIQRHLERYFTKYLNINASIPYRTRLLSSIEIDKKINIVKGHLLKSHLDEKLLKIINKLLEKLSRITLEERFTYQALLYHKMVLNEIYKVIETKENSLSNESLIELLYRLNFNSVDFFYYLTSRIEYLTAVEKAYEDKKKLLYLYQKTYRQLPVKTNLFFQKGLLPIRTQILNWIQEEIYYLKKVSRPKPEENKIEPIAAKTKITTQLSVAQLAYILKIMHETGLIRAKSQWDMFRFLQENVGSKRQESLSAHSLNNKYYQVEAATKASVKDMLLNLLHHISKTK